MLQKHIKTRHLKPDLLSVAHNSQQRPAICQRQIAVLVFAQIGVAAVVPRRTTDRSIESVRSPSRDHRLGLIKDWSTVTMWIRHQIPLAAPFDFERARRSRRQAHPNAQTPRRASRQIAPALDRLESRCLLALTPIMGPTPPVGSLNLQLQSSSPAALASLAGAPRAPAQRPTRPPSPVFTKSLHPPRSWALATQLSTQSAVKFTAPTLNVQAAKAPNDPYYAAVQWGLNGAFGINAPTAWSATTGSNSSHRRRHRLRYQLPSPGPRR